MTPTLREEPGGMCRETVSLKGSGDLEVKGLETGFLQRHLDQTEVVSSWEKFPKTFERERLINFSTQCPLINKDFHMTPGPRFDDPTFLDCENRIVWGNVVTNCLNMQSIDKGNS